ncbi:MAG: cob(I)alamin adenosyltransferase [Clostridia bacterium]|nr:cob(I)alamin adenosyltransferase [Clostridia bacterium]
MERELKTYMGQFIKGQYYGKLKSAEMVGTYITIEQYGKDPFTHVVNPPHSEDIKMAQDGLEKARTAMYSGKYDIIILDEINTANYFNLISTEEILDLIKNKPEGIELILTAVT